MSQVDDDSEIEASRAPLMDHLVELRQRLIFSILALAAGFGALLAAVSEIGAALKAADGQLDIDRILTPLRAGYTELELAADALPGFEKVSYERACCGRSRIQ